MQISGPNIFTYFFIVPLLHGIQLETHHRDIFVRNIKPYRYLLPILTVEAIGISQSVMLDPSYRQTCPVS